jgi:hypothetical protein
MTGTENSRSGPRRRRWRGSGASAIIVVCAAAFVALRVTSGSLDFTNGQGGHGDAASLLLDVAAVLIALVIAIGIPAWILWRRGQLRNAVIMERQPAVRLLA